LVLGINFIGIVLSGILTPQCNANTLV